MESGNAVRVHVINSVTGSPISGANVALQQERDTLRGRTDVGGMFAGRTHFAGNYLLIVTSKGLRMMTGAGMMGKMVEARAGTETDLSVQMLPLGVITGRVLDQYGDPVRHAIVSTHDKQGATVQDQYYPSDRAATTDDRGEYRIAEVEPGKHYLAVEYSSADDERRAAGHSRYRWPQTGGLTLYPDTTDIDQAQQVEVGAGQTTRLNDVNLNIQPALTISGHVTPPPVDRSQSLNLVRSKLTLHTAAIIQAADSEADGSFKIDVLPGKYILTASDSKTGGTSRELPVEVRDKSITGLELELRSGYDIRGRFIIDGQERIDLSKLVLTFGGLPLKID